MEQDEELVDVQEFFHDINEPSDNLICLQDPQRAYPQGTVQPESVVAPVPPRAEGDFHFDRADEGHFLGHVPPAPPCGKSQVADLTTESFTFLFLNIKGYVSDEAELYALIESSNSLTFIRLNETFLPGEGVVKHVDLKGYVKISRLDRRDGSGWGGILLFAKRGYEDYIVHVER